MSRIAATFRVKPETRERIDALAMALDCEKSHVIDSAVQHFFAVKGSDVGRLERRLSSLRNSARTAA